MIGLGNVFTLKIFHCLFQCVIGLVKLIVEKLQKRKTSVDHIELINCRNSFSISNE